MDYKEIGARIREARKTMDMTQEQLAEKADLSVGYVSQVETGVKCVSLQTLYRIAQVLDTTVQSLLASAETSSTERVATMFSGCEAWEQEIITEVAEAVRNSLRKHKAAIE